MLDVGTMHKGHPGGLSKGQQPGQLFLLKPDLTHTHYKLQQQTKAVDGRRVTIKFDKRYTLADVVAL